MAFNKTDRPEGAKMRRPGGMRRRKKVCVFCGDKNGVIDYKDTNKLKRYLFFAHTDRKQDRGTGKLKNPKGFCSSGKEKLGTGPAPV